MTSHCWSSWGCSLDICGIVWLRLQSQKAKPMLATVQNCICGGQSLIEGWPWCGVWQKRVQLFILFLRWTLPSQQSKAVQKTQVYQHLGEKKKKKHESGRIIQGICRYTVLHNSTEAPLFLSLYFAQKIENDKLLLSEVLAGLVYFMFI